MTDVAELGDPRFLPLSDLVFRGRVSERSNPSLTGSFSLLMIRGRARFPVMLDS